MDESEIRGRIVKGLFWKVLENGGAQAVMFVVTIILARLLSPAEYGLIGIIMVFVTIANVIVQNGFSTALVQRKDSNDTDFSSVFYFSLLLSAVMYGLLFLFAPLVGRFYEKEILVPVLRVLSLVLFPGAIISVQTAYLSKRMEFRGLFLSTIIAAIISGAVSIFMAYSGYGVWAMVAQQLLYYLVLMVSLLCTVSWRPAALFSFERLRIMFSFGWKILAAALVDTLFNNMYGLLMGKIYNESLLGAYNRGEQFPKLIVTNLGSAIQSVMLPAFSASQDDLSKVRSMVRRAIKLSSYLILPMLAGLFAVADPLILALLGEDWMVCVPYLRIMCVAYAFWPIHITNLQAINAMGRSDMFLKLEIVKKSIGILGLLIGMRYSPVIMIAIKAGIDFLCTFINAWPNKKLLGYSIFQQWSDILPSMCISVLMGGAVYWLADAAVMNAWVELLILIPVGAVIYVLLSLVFRVESFQYLLNIVRLRGKHNR